MKHVADGPAAARLGDRPCDDLIRARAGVDRLDAGEALFEHWQDFVAVSGVKVP